MPNTVPEPQFKITRTRSTQRNFTVIISNFWACSCRPIHKRLLLCSVLQVYMCLTKQNKIKKWQNKKNVEKVKKTTKKVKTFSTSSMIQRWEKCMNRQYTMLRSVRSIIHLIRSLAPSTPAPFNRPIHWLDTWPHTTLLASEIILGASHLFLLP